MGSILEILTSALGGGAIDTISKKLGLSKATTSMIVQAALPLLLSALARNSSTPAGANSLQNALKKDHDGSILDDVLGAFTNSEQSDGASILGHIFGTQRPSVQQGLGKATNADPQQVGQVLEMLAPILMGALGKQTTQSNLDAGSLSDLLRGTAQQAQKAQPVQPDVMDSLLGMLDTNKDGSVIDDVGGFLSKFFRK
ncbi:MAG TPA: DUF937 domain-containing protein [Bacteroidota bacterium]|nr:DUF937 domain-containing protein [Bacteroidota bacterium]